MEELKDYYKILELNDSDKKLDDESFYKKVKSNYRKLSLKYHPDRNSDKSEEEKKRLENKFKDCVEAYNVLSNPQKRKEYDMYNNGFFDSGFDLNGFMYGFMDNETFGFNPFGRHQRRVVKGTDIHLNMSVSIEDLYNTITKTITFNKVTKCNHCNGNGLGENGHIEECHYCHGTGFIENTQRRGNTIFTQRTTCPYCQGQGKTIINPCSYCNGTGLEKQQTSMEILLPKGTTVGTVLTMQNKGNDSQDANGIPGDLYIHIKVKEHPNFDVSGSNPYNLVSLQEISVLDCITGGIFDITCIDGVTYQYKIEPNTEQGTIMVVKGKGLPKGDGTFGDMNIIIKHKFPNRELNKKELELIDKLKKSINN